MIDEVVSPKRRRRLYDETLRSHAAADLLTPMIRANYADIRFVEQRNAPRDITRETTQALLSAEPHANCWLMNRFTLGQITRWGRDEIGEPRELLSPTIYLFGIPMLIVARDFVADNNLVVCIVAAAPAEIAGTAPRPLRRLVMT